MQIIIQKQLFKLRKYIKYDRIKVFFLKKTREYGELSKNILSFLN